MDKKISMSGVLKARHNLTHCEIFRPKDVASAQDVGLAVLYIRHSQTEHHNAART